MKRRLAAILAAERVGYSCLMEADEEATLNAYRKVIDDLLYLVRETKGTLNLDDLRPDEKREIACGRSHFGDALDASDRVVTDASQLPGGRV